MAFDWFVWPFDVFTASCSQVLYYIVFSSKGRVSLSYVKRVVWWTRAAYVHVLLSNVVTSLISNDASYFSTL